MVDFERKFTTLVAFILKLKLSDEEKAKNLEEMLHTRYKDIVLFR